MALAVRLSLLASLLRGLRRIPSDFIETYAAAIDRTFTKGINASIHPLETYPTCLLYYQCVNMLLQSLF